MTLTIILIVAFLGAAYWLFTRVYRPLCRVRDLVSHLEAGRPRGGYIPEGAWGLPELIRKLELLDNRIASLEKHASADKFNLQATMANMVEGFMVVDRDMQVQQANEALVQMFGIRTDPIGKPVRAILRHAGVQEVIDASMQQGRQISRQIHLEDLGGDAPVRSFEMNASPLFDIVQRISGAVIVFHDVSKVRQLEEVRREFVANVSHELRTPLSIFRGYLETIEDTPQMETEEVRRILAVMRRHSDRLNALVEDLLLLARLESKRLPMEIEPVNIRGFFSNLVADWKRLVEVKECELEMQIDPLLDVVDADPLRLEQVLINLLENALKYSNPRGIIQVGAELDAKSDQVHFWVKDQGIGIPQDKLTHIFERFYRVDKARSRDQGGSGLGLSIVKHIVQAHGGRVWAESEVARGTSIHFTLPMISEAVEEIAVVGDTKRIRLG
jgi:two-component system phosphate regulon sensor histidine kinase PhoR